ncbi:hypothetical protein DFH06DRAFT_334 [Mycena polygramma]|nr:hypothetical protein DFH06DRAFT_334 [Mycena polygramma]
MIRSSGALFLPSSTLKTLDWCCQPRAAQKQKGALKDHIRHRKGQAKPGCRGLSVLAHSERTRRRTRTGGKAMTPARASQTILPSHPKPSAEGAFLIRRQATHSTPAFHSACRIRPLSALGGHPRTTHHESRLCPRLGTSDRPGGYIKADTRFSPHGASLERMLSIGRRPVIFAYPPLRCSARGQHRESHASPAPAAQIYRGRGRTPTPACSHTAFVGHHPRGRSCISSSDPRGGVASHVWLTNGALSPPPNFVAVDREDTRVRECAALPLLLLHYPDPRCQPIKLSLPADSEKAPLLDERRPIIVEYTSGGGAHRSA